MGWSSALQAEVQMGSLPISSTSSGLIHGFTLSTTTDETGFSMWLAAKDHLKINEGEVKEVNYVGVTEQA